MDPSEETILFPWFTGELIPPEVRASQPPAPVWPVARPSVTDRVSDFFEGQSPLVLAALGFVVIAFLSSRGRR